MLPLHQIRIVCHCFNTAKIYIFSEISKYLENFFQKIFQSGFGTSCFSFRSKMSNNLSSSQLRYLSIIVTPLPVKNHHTNNTIKQGKIERVSNNTNPINSNLAATNSFIFFSINPAPGNPFRALLGGGGMALSPSVVKHYIILLSFFEKIRPFPIGSGRSAVSPPHLAVGVMRPSAMLWVGLNGGSTDCCQLLRLTTARRAVG